MQNKWIVRLIAVSSLLFIIILSGATVYFHAMNKAHRMAYQSSLSIVRTLYQATATTKLRILLSHQIEPGSQADFFIHNWVSMVLNANAPQPSSNIFSAKSAISIVSSNKISTVVFPFQDIRRYGPNGYETIRGRAIVSLTAPPKPSIISIHLNFNPTIRPERPNPSGLNIPHTIPVPGLPLGR